MTHQQFFKNTYFSLLTTLMLTACGGSGGGSNGNSDPQQPTVLTGIFIDGPVAGLRYSTATQSGFTSTAGEFNYTSGEEVTFSIGAIELGKAIGQAEINPFDLFGITPPNTEIEIREELANRYNVTDFDRVANMALLLVSLDNDADLTNGLDLTGWDAKLANASIDFDQNLYAFHQKYFEFARQYKVNHWVSVITPLQHLYDSLGIVIPVHAVETVSADYDNDGNIDEAWAFQYNIKGLLMEEGFDWNADGSFEVVITYAYDDLNQEIEYRQDSDTDQDGVVEWLFLNTKMYNESGLLMEDEIEQDTNSDNVIDFWEKETFTYDAIANNINSIWQRDANGDSVIDATITREKTYNEGRVVEITTSDDADNDGLVDLVETQSITYDEKNNPLEEVKLIDAGNNGTTDFEILESHEYTYDNNDRILIHSLSSDNNNDGLADSQSLRTYIYDRAGNLTTEREAVDDDADGNPDFRIEFIKTFNSAGQPLTVTENTDGDGNLTVDSSEYTVTRYSINGFVEQIETSKDNDANGVNDNRMVITYQGDANGNQLTILEEIDNDNDGVFDEEELISKTFIEIVDGLSYLLQHYQYSTIN